MGDRTVVRKNKCATEGIQIIAMGRDRNRTYILGIRRIKGDPAVGSGLHLWSQLSMGQSFKIIYIFR